MMVTGLSAWRSSCPSGPSTDSPPASPSRPPPAAGSPRPARAARAHPAAGPHRTPLRHHRGITLAGPAGVARYRPATALPAGGSDGPARQAATGRP